MRQWERYRLFVRHFDSSGERVRRWMDEVREVERRLGRDGWFLVSTNAFIDDDDALIEILWFQRPITPDAPPPPEEHALGF